MGYGIVVAGVETCRFHISSYRSPIETKVTIVQLLYYFNTGEFPLKCGKRETSYYPITYRVPPVNMGNRTEQPYDQ
jgi:hypothetical protein